MQFKELLLETSPFLSEDTNNILFYSKAAEKEELNDYLYDEITRTNVEYYILKFCEFANAYISMHRAPNTYKQKLREKVEQWCMAIGRKVNYQDDAIREIIDNILCTPFKEDITCKVLKEMHGRDGVSGEELANKLGVNKKTIYNEIEKIKGTKGTARIYGQQIKVPVSEYYVAGDSSKAHIKKQFTRNTVSPVMLQMNISQTATLLSSLAHMYLTVGKSIARTLGFEVWAQLSDYARERIRFIYADMDEELIEFIDELSAALKEEQVIGFQTEIEAFDDLNIGEQVTTLIKTGRKCTVTVIDDGKKEVLFHCVVKKIRKGKGILFEGIREDRRSATFEFVEGLDVKIELENSSC